MPLDLPISAIDSGRDEARGKDVLTELQDWVRAELMPWRFFQPERESITTLVQRAIDDDPSVFRFTIQDGLVTFHAKPSAMLPGHDVYRDLLDRGEMYRRFLQAVVDATSLTGTTDLAIDLDDLADRTADGPVLCFQKVRGSRSILIPDVDVLDYDFFLGDRTHDTVPFADKIDAAIFVGSTTGMLNIDHATVEQLAHRRLRSAVYFRNNPEVRYELPGVVQCDGPETEAMIRALDLGHNACPWSEQLNYRYLMSVDGNGATCSRVAIALKSNSVLMKYNSINDLYYFHGLKPWHHYVPLERDLDAIDNLALLRRMPDLPTSLVAESRAFYRAYLSRIAVIRYTAELLRRYMATFGTSVGSFDEGSVFAIDSFSHIKDQGDVWSQPNGWNQAAEGNWIEAITLIQGPEIAPGDLAYRTIDANGETSDHAAPWQLSGGRGRAQAIHGFEVRLSGAAADRLTLQYEARFLDGTHVGPIPGGSICASPTRAALTAFRLILRRKPGSAPA